MLNNSWIIVSSLANLVTGLGIFFLGYQVLLQRRTFSLDQVQYLLGLSNQFTNHKKRISRAWNILRELKLSGKSLSNEKWHEAVEALESYYESALFLFQLAKLVDGGVINPKLLYLLYYNNVIDHSSGIFQTQGKGGAGPVLIIATSTQLAGQLRT